LFCDNSFDPWINLRTSISRSALKREETRSAPGPAKARNRAKQSSPWHSELRKAGPGGFGGDLPFRLAQQISEQSGGPLHFRPPRIIGVDQAEGHDAKLKLIDRSINPSSSVQKLVSGLDLGAMKEFESQVTS
jgi:hypothetical protein